MNLGVIRKVSLHGGVNEAIFLFGPSAGLFFAAESEKEIDGEYETQQHQNPEDQDHDPKGVRLIAGVHRSFDVIRACERSIGMSIAKIL
ncbi:hypothetical protein CHS0354_026554 [Potamilus streckersoni]|uniref:Uncharacterized protein n=1 Tax=Potamilus streckersoni TaxID=2493646 RepID=A0AAE0RQR1_9BIVA|nr:hypothetical protein CHS0354_026554 [Potamilus streckersoni]